MNIPQIPTGRNSYYDLGPTKQFDVEIIREALRLYEDNLAEKFETAKSNSIERIEMGAKRYLRRRSSQDLADTYPCTQTERNLIKI